MSRLEFSHPSGSSRIIAEYRPSRRGDDLFACLSQSLFLIALHPEAHDYRISASRFRCARLYRSGGPAMMRHAPRLAVAGGALAALCVATADRSQGFADQTQSGRGSATTQTGSAPAPRPATARAASVIDVTVAEGTSMSVSVS